jgi:class 3 adenylate cyclase/tetratricopeptide (TPR) repeat protein
VPACPNCGKDNPEGFAFCGFCGTALAPAAPVGGEERKTVTVLFADLVGFTSTAERLDPEDVRRLLSPYYSKLRHELERHGGTVEKFIGDAVMAVFGAPVAHEDDPERAVRSAIAIRNELTQEGSPLQVRIAVNTGEALVTLGARPVEGEGMVAGDVVNTAARMQSAAPVNGILVGGATYRATNDVIEYREADPISAKGKAGLVSVWEALAARSRFGLDVEQRPRTPLVGRTRELGFLTDALDRARTERSPQLVTLVGVPGIGKSRLVSELFQVVEREPELITWRQGRSLPYGESLSYWALGEIVKAQAGIVDNDDEDVASDKLHEAVASALPDADDAPWVEGHVRPLVGLAGADESQSQDKTEAFSAWRRFLEGLAEQRPLVLVFEDLHWADDGLLDFVDHLSDWASAVPLLIVCMARPELLDRRPGWGGGKRNAATLSIGALSREDTARLLADLLEQALLPAEVQATVLERAEGNPLYAEEYVRMLRDRGLLTHDDDRGWQLAASGELPLPETVQGMIAARLDTLAPEEKDLVQDAAVVGKVFWPGALVAIGAIQKTNLDLILHSLERKELVRREHRSAISGERQFAFLHILVRDVGYAQIPRARRVEKHRAAAEWIASLGTERSEDRAEMLAHHYVEALELAGAAGIETESFRDVARSALADAGERALALNSALPALRFSERALELTSPEDPLTATLLVRCVRARWLLGEFGEALEEAGVGAVDAAIAAGDKELAAEVTSILAQNAWIDTRHDRAMELSARAVALVEDMPPSPTRARVRAQDARRLFLAGSENGEALARSTLAEAEALELDDVASHTLNTIGMATIARDPEGGLESLRRSISIAEGINNPFLITTGYNNLASMLWALGRLEEGVQTQQLARIGNERFGSSAGIRWGDAEDVFVAWVFGRWEEALRRADAYIASEDPVPYQKAGVRMLRSELRAGMGHLVGALEDSTLALETAREVKDPQVLVPGLGVHALALVQAGRTDEAGAVLDELLSFDFSGVTPTWLIGNGMAFRAVGRSAQYLESLSRITLRSSPWAVAEIAVAEDRLADAARIYEDIGARGEAARAWLAEGERAFAAGGANEAEPALRRALELSETAGASEWARRAESLLAASA